MAVLQEITVVLGKEVILMHAGPHCATSLNPTSMKITETAILVQEELINKCVCGGL